MQSFSCPAHRRSVTAPSQHFLTESGRRRRRSECLVAAAISKQKKTEIVQQLTESLRESVLVYGLNYDGVKVKAMETMRRELPEGSTMLVTKNRLLRVAVDSLDEESQAKWACLKGQKGQNAYVFASEDAIRGSVKAFNDFQKALKALQPEPKKGMPPPPPPTQIKCVIMDGEEVNSSQWKTLEKIPTKQELLTSIARGIKANPTRVAVSLKAIPRKLAYGIKALSELNEDENMTVADAVAAKASADSS